MYYTCILYIGNIFLTTNAKVLFNQYKNYASGQQRCLQILKGMYIYVYSI